MRAKGRLWHSVRTEWKLHDVKRNEPAKAEKVCQQDIFVREREVWTDMWASKMSWSEEDVVEAPVGQISLPLENTPLIPCGDPHWETLFICMCVCVGKSVWVRITCVWKNGWQKASQLDMVSVRSCSTTVFVEQLHDNCVQRCSTALRTANTHTPAQTHTRTKTHPITLSGSLSGPVTSSQALVASCHRLTVENRPASLVHLCLCNRQTIQSLQALFFFFFF